MTGLANPRPMVNKLTRSLAARRERFMGADSIRGPGEILLASSRMQRNVVRLAAVFGALAVLAVSGPATAITYGTIDPGHPNVGAILFFSLRLNRWVEFCSGSLVSARVFLTAGHCTDGLAARGAGPDRIRVSFSPDLFAKNARWLEIESYATDPDYNWGPTSDPHDIGAIVLAKPVRDITPAKLAPVGYLDGLAASGVLAAATFINVGYGADENLEPTGVRMISHSSFLSLHNAWLYMSQNNHSDGGGTCFGDSGGPTFYDDGTTEWIVATVSWGDAQCVATNINYRADLQVGQDFVYGVIAETS